MLEENKEINPFVGKHKRQSLLDTTRLRIISLASVVDETPLGICLFLLVEPTGCRRVVGKKYARDD